MFTYASLFPFFFPMIRGVQFTRTSINFFFGPVEKHTIRTGTKSSTKITFFAVWSQKPNPSQLCVKQTHQPNEKNLVAIPKMLRAYYYTFSLSLSRTMRIESTNSIDYGSKENRWTNWEKTHLLTSNLIVFGGKKGWSTTPPNTPTSLTTNPPKY